MTEKYPALKWDELGQSVQHDLAKKGLGAGWFASKEGGAKAELRKTVLTLYVKMTGTSINGRKLWEFVGSQRNVTPGSLEFVAVPSIVFFMGALKGATRQFTDPGEDPADWDSREYIPHMQLHFKRSKKWGWNDTNANPNQVEVHIDPHGLYSGPGIGQVNLAQMIYHGCTQSGYKKVDEIQEWLVKKNWGKTILIK
jgi:hypothetical protein